MDEILRASAWGWTELVLPALRMKPLEASYSRPGWRSHLLRAHSVQGALPEDLSASAAICEPGLHDLLSSLTGPFAEKRCEARLEQGSPGLRADAACDRAWHAVRAQDPGGSMRWANRALEILPGHAEALRWKGFLCSLPLPRGRSSAQLDQLSIFPRASSAWLSAERWRRRGLSGRWIRPAPPQSALFELQEMGIHTRELAPESWWASQPAGHPGVSMEALVDHILARIRSLRPATTLAWTAWDLASRQGSTWVLPLAKFLARAAMTEPSLIRPGLLASRVATQSHPGPSIWQAIRARLLAESGRRVEAMTLAREILRGTAEAETLRLAIGTMVRCGHTREARRAGLATGLEPGLRLTSLHPHRCIVP